MNNTFFIQFSAFNDLLIIIKINFNTSQAKKTVHLIPFLNIFSYICCKSYGMPYYMNVICTACTLF